MGSLTAQWWKELHDTDMTIDLTALGCLVGSEMCIRDRHTVPNNSKAPLSQPKPKPADRSSHHEINHRLLHGFPDSAVVECTPRHRHE